ncbi:MAG: flagellin N-terminal helical domain-containing protein [Planctomycetota bacterium]|jgi:flagellin
MDELGKILDPAHGVPAPNAAGKNIPELTETTASQVSAGDEAALAINQNPLRGQVASVRHNSHSAEIVVSLVQTIGQAITGLRERQTKIGELAKQVAARRHSPEEMAQVQQELKRLAGEINDIVENTEYNGNKLFSADGQDISISIGNGSTIEISAKDFSLDVEGINLSANSESMVEKIREEIEAIRDYDGFLLGVKEKVEDVKTLMQFELENILEVAENVTERNMNLELGAFSLVRVAEEARKALRGQANVTSNTALKLLRDFTEGE